EAGGDDGLGSALGDAADQREQSFDDQSGGGHDQIEGGEQSDGQGGAVVLAVDEHQRQGDEISEDERDHTAEADTTVPQGGGHRDIADRAHEADEGDEGPNDDVLQARPEPVAGKEDLVPPAHRDQHGEETGNRVADH